MPAALHSIGTLAENSLHADLKTWYAQEQDLSEVRLDGYHIDLLRGELLIEIQTRNFYAIRLKLRRLLGTHPVRLVHPIARERWIVRRDGSGEIISRRKSPRHGRLEWIFHELSALGELLPLPNFSLEILLTREEEILVPVGELPGSQRKTSWRRRGWRIADRHLLDVVDRCLVLDYRGLLDFLPKGLPIPFTTYDVQRVGGLDYRTAQRMLLTLYRCGLINRLERRGRLYLYTLSTLES